MFRDTYSSQGAIVTGMSIQEQGFQEVARMKCCFPNPRFRLISEGLYRCEDEQVMEILRSHLASGNHKFIPQDELGQNRSESK